jgi:hypothetical protein
MRQALERMKLNRLAQTSESPRECSNRWARRRKAMAEMPRIGDQTPLPDERLYEKLFSNDPLLSAIGIAKELWVNQHADEYMAQFRKDW